MSQINPHLFSLNSRMSISANLDPQTQDSRESCLGKEKVLGTQLSSVSSDGIEGVIHLDLSLRLVHGPLGTWEISHSNITKVDPSISQLPNPKSYDSLKPKHHFVSQHTIPKPISNSKPKHLSTQPKHLSTSVGQHLSTQPISNYKPKPTPNPKPKPTSNPKPNFGWPNSKPKDHTHSNPKPPISKPNVLPASNPKPNCKPTLKWKPKAHRPSLSQHLTHPHSSQAPPSLPFFSNPSVMGNLRSKA